MLEDEYPNIFLRQMEATMFIILKIFLAGRYSGMGRV